MVNKVIVRNLFGTFDYDVEFPKNERNLSVLHGLNGSGKTTILKMIVAAATCDEAYFASVPFDFFSVEFDSGVCVEVSNGANGVEFARVGDFSNVSVPVYLDCEKPVSDETLKEFSSFVAGNSHGERAKEFVRLLKNFFFDEHYDKRFYVGEDGISAVMFTGRKIPLEVLGFGERNLLSILFNAAFVVPNDGTLILDLPESSLHVLWQRRFLGVLTKVLSGRGVQLIVATHSPDVVSRFFDFFVSLSSNDDEED